jgi:hypothetical protein
VQSVDLARGRIALTMKSGQGVAPAAAPAKAAPSKKPAPKAAPTFVPKSGAVAPNGIRFK